jgi:hypothetical protein
MNDAVLEAFLLEQYRQGQELTAQSDLVRLRPMDGSTSPPAFYVAQFLCKGLVCGPEGTITEASEFLIGISFLRDHLRRVDPTRILTFLDPVQIWHPNIQPPSICVGAIVPGVGLVDLLYQCFEILTYRNVAFHDALNVHAAQWARNHMHLLPIDRRPLKRRTVTLHLREEAS